MQAFIVTIGDELLNGQTQDTNSNWMARKLNEIGIQIHEMRAISDEAQHIKDTLSSIPEHIDLVFITGGLGPTKDDITKHTLAAFFGDSLIHDELVWQHLQERFKNRPPEVLERNRIQAQVPSRCQVIMNHKGTAPGMQFEHEGRLYFSMPGVPYEMKGLMRSGILPMLQERFQLPVIVHRHLMTAGIGESALAGKIAAIEMQLPAEIKLAYLPSAGTVKLRLSAAGQDANQLKALIEKAEQLLLSVIGEHVYGFDNEPLEQAIGRIIKEQSLSLSTVESCTGGAIGARLINTPGSSAYYKGGTIAYDNSLKIDLGVDAATIEQHGVVSEAVVSEMLLAAQMSFKSECVIATSGIAGPTGGSPDKPVGTVVIGIAIKERFVIDTYHFTNDRKSNIALATTYALEALRRCLVS